MLLELLRSGLDEFLQALVIDVLCTPLWNLVSGKISSELHDGMLAKGGQIEASM